MKNHLITAIVTGATAAVLASAAFGQANPTSTGYWLEQYGTPDNNIWRSGSFGGIKGINDTLCWRASYWTPAMAIVECDPDLVPKPVVAQVTPPPRRRAASSCPGSAAPGARAASAEDHAGEQGAV